MLICTRSATLRRKKKQTRHWLPMLYGITSNSRMLTRFRSEVTRRWHYWLNRRSQRRQWSWERVRQFLARCPLPSATPVHSTYRLAAKP